MPLMTPRIAVAEHAAPLAVAISREKKYFSSKTPTGVAMYLLLVTRETVDSCRPSSEAISRASGLEGETISPSMAAMSRPRPKEWLETEPPAVSLGWHLCIFPFRVYSTGD